MRVTARRTVCTASMLLSSVAGCSSGTGPEWVRDIGMLDPTLSRVPTVAGPRTARVGTPFTLVVTTVGSGSCVRASGATVRVHAAGVDVVPMDERYVGTGACQDIVNTFPREVSMVLMTPGEATINVTGYSAGTPGMVTVMHTVRVDP